MPTTTTSTTTAPPVLLQRYYTNHGVTAPWLTALVLFTFALSVTTGYIVGWWRSVND